MFKGFLNKSKTSLANKESIFIHIPKCGGSTLVGLLMDSVKEQNFVPTTPTHKIGLVGNIKIMHVDFSSRDRVFKSPFIFDSSRSQEFKDNLLFMLFRNPVERIASEFNFQYHVLNGKQGNANAAILGKLKGSPSSLEEYIEYRETQNYQIKFLLGRPLADTKRVENSDFEKIKTMIQEFPIYCGITEEYASFLNVFEQKTGLKLKKKVLIRKKTPFLFNVPVSDEIRKRIIDLNAFDYKLFTYIKENVIINNKKFVFQEKDQFIT